MSGESVELRINYDTDEVECIWGTAHRDPETLIHGNPRPDRGEVGHLLLAMGSYIKRLLRDGPEIHHGALHEVVSHEDRLFARIEYGGKRWSWELFPAHWWDGAGRFDPDGVWVGRWPD